MIFQARRHGTKARIANMNYIFRLLPLLFLFLTACTAESNSGWVGVKLPEKGNIDWENDPPTLHTKSFSYNPLQQDAYYYPYRWKRVVFEDLTFVAGDSLKLWGNFSLRAYIPQDKLQNFLRYDGRTWDKVEQALEKELSQALGTCSGEVKGYEAYASQRGPIIECAQAALKNDYLKFGELVLESDLQIPDALRESLHAAIMVDSQRQAILRRAKDHADAMRITTTAETERLKEIARVNVLVNKVVCQGANPDLLLEAD